MANNPYVNKVQTADGTVLIDISDTTATVDDVLATAVFYTADGSSATGTITTRAITDITVSGRNVTVREGYYPGQMVKQVASGTAGTPTATKGTVSNHSVTVTPSVTNTTGYITGSTKTGTAVTVTAAELASGELEITGSGSTSVVGYSTVSVAEGTEGTPVATKGTVSNHSITVTPSVTNGEGWIDGSTKTGTAVTVTASELASGNKSITSSGSTSVVGYSTASVAAGTAGTPTATKGTVTNHSVTVTPSVTNTTGYITGSTKTGTAVTVTATELASGSKTISANGTGIDVVGYSTVDVAVPIVHYYTGSSAPSASLGDDGDIYLQTT